MQKVGSFTVENGLIISDPSYNFNPNKINNDSFKIQEYFPKEQVKQGEWDSYVEYDEESGRVAMLRAFHSSLIKEILAGDWKPCEGFIGVDSGQAGIYDSKYFKQDSVVGDYPLAKYIMDLDKKGEKWYAMCCQQTYDESNFSKRAGIIPYGVVSGSGYGDGAYDYGVCKKNGLICGIEILYLFKYNNGEDNNNE